MEWRKSCIALCVLLQGAKIDPANDPTAAIYQELSEHVRDVSSNGGGMPLRTRFVVDILSGTSAGGINAIYLAKAIAIRARDLKSVRDTWLNTADLERLLNTGDPFNAKRCVNGRLDVASSSMKPSAR